MLLYDSLNETLFERFPVLKGPHYEALIYGCEDLPYIVFGVQFGQYLVESATDGSLEVRADAAAFLEDMATASDNRVSDLFTIEMLPRLVESQTMVDAYWALLGPSTRRRLRRLHPRFFRNAELPSSED